MATRKPNPDATADTATDGATDTPAETPAETRLPLAEPEGGWPADEYTGLPGSYVRDPYTGIRTPLVE